MRVKLTGKSLEIPYLQSGRTIEDPALILEVPNEIAERLLADRYAIEAPPEDAGPTPELSGQAVDANVPADETEVEPEIRRKKSRPRQT